MKSFIREHVEKGVTPTSDSLADFVENWHTGVIFKGASLADAIGLNNCEYAEFMFSEQVVFDKIARLQVFCSKQ